MLIIAHRGLKKEYPENTLPAFRAAAAFGFGIEVDIRLTKDAQLVCLHNPDIGSMTGAKMSVRESTVGELQRFGIQESGATIPRFADVAEQVIAGFQPNQKAAIHVKADEQGAEQLRILLELFQRYQLYEKAFLFDLKLETAAQVRSMDARIELAVSVGEENYTPTIYLWEQVQPSLGLFDAVWWDEWRVSGAEYTEERAQAIHGAGKRLYAISPELHADHGHAHAQTRYEQDWRNFIQWGVDGVCTAYPREFQALVRG